jgi:hypothetical protein
LEKFAQGLVLKDRSMSDKMLYSKTVQIPISGPPLYGGWIRPVAVFLCLISAFLGTESLWPEKQPWNYILIFMYAAMTIVAVLWVLRQKEIAVFDCGDHLLIKKGELSERISFANISNISVGGPDVPSELVTLELRQPTRFGRNITFYQKNNNLIPSDVIFFELMSRIGKVEMQKDQCQNSLRDI